MLKFPPYNLVAHRCAVRYRSYRLKLMDDVVNPHREAVGYQGLRSTVGRRRIRRSLSDSANRVISNELRSLEKFFDTPLDIRILTHRAETN
jgi:hypothetical protein